jgi:rfaE bifunctional protein nucleotidyltransferase chain/domain
VKPNAARLGNALLAERAGWRAGDRRVAFTNGCFDLLHAGHVQLLEQARALGDCLVVGLNGDASVSALKGPRRPALPEAERAELLLSLEAVDRVVVFDEPTPAQLIAALLPDVLVKGADWDADAIVGSDEVLAHGGRVARVPLVPGRSTTSILERLRRP